MPYLPPPAAVVGQAGAVTGVGALVQGQSRVSVAGALPAAGGSAGGSIDATLMQVMVATAVREMIDHPDSASAGNQDSSTDGDADDTETAPVSFAAAVIAVHDERIALLRDRLATLCSADGASPLLAGLRERLRRAEAARRLATERAGARTPSIGSGPVAGCAIATSTVVKTPAYRPVHAAVVRWIDQPPRPSLRMHDAGLMRVLPHAAARHARRPAVWRVVHVARYRHRSLAHYKAAERPMVATLPTARVVRHADSGRSVALRLAHARHSLAIARRALADAAAMPTLRRTPVLATPWRGDGGDRWTLSARFLSIADRSGWHEPRGWPLSRVASARMGSAAYIR